MIQPDKDMQDLVDAVLAPHRAMLDTVVGRTDTLLDRATSLSAPMETFFWPPLPALRERTSPSRMAGAMTMNDLWNIVPVNPPITTVEMTGDELRTMMEQNLESVFSPDPFKQMGGYVKRCFGINLYVKIENPAGHRIQQLFVGGRLIDRSARYRVAGITAQSVPRLRSRRTSDRCHHSDAELFEGGTGHRPRVGEIRHCRVMPPDKPGTRMT